MKNLLSPFRVLVALGFALAIPFLFGGAVVHYAADDSPAGMVADAAAYRGEYLAGTAIDIGSVICFGLVALGLTAFIRGRGQTFARIAAVILVLGLPAHVFGGVANLVLVSVADSAISAQSQVKVVESFFTTSGIYFAMVAPFLLAVVLTTAALWRARAVSWGPLALALVDLIVIGRFTDGTAPSSWVWWLDPLVMTVAYGWLAWGLLRYRPAPTSEATAAARSGVPAYESLPAKSHE